MTTIRDQQVGMDDVKEFFNIIHKNIFNPHGKILSLIESLSYGNVRLALNILSLFMTSNTTDVGKILRTYIETGSYTIPFHEFVKSVTLGEKKFYKEERSFIINLYTINACPYASHFTGLRLLTYLNSRINISTTYGKGFVDLIDLLCLFEEHYGNRTDVVQTILRFIKINRHLVELDTRRTDSIEEASSIRITPAGAFYLTQLYDKLAYLDLMLQDTPINDSGLAQILSKLIYSTNFTDRFSRIEKFLEYLQHEEDVEYTKLNLHLAPEPFNKLYAKDIYSQYLSEKEYIIRKHTQNIQRVQCVQ